MTVARPVAWLRTTGGRAPGLFTQTPPPLPLGAPGGGSRLLRAGSRQSDPFRAGPRRRTGRVQPLPGNGRPQGLPGSQVVHLLYRHRHGEPQLVRRQYLLLLRRRALRDAVHRLPPRLGRPRRDGHPTDALSRGGIHRTDLRPRGAADLRALPPPPGLGHEVATPVPRPGCACGLPLRQSLRRTRSRRGGIPAGASAVRARSRSPAAYPRGCRKSSRRRPSSGD